MFPPGDGDDVGKVIVVLGKCGKVKAVVRVGLRYIEGENGYSDEVRA